MKRMKITVLALVLAAIVTVSYSILGQGPGDDDQGPVGGIGDGTTPPDAPPTPGDQDGEIGPVGVVNELHHVIHEWDADGVDALKHLLTEGADPNVVDENGLTGLQIAVLNSDLNPVAQQQLDALLEGGADPNKATQSGSSPLHIASGWNGDGALVASLIRHGANPDLPDSSGKTPLEIALRDGNEGAIHVLRKATAARPANYDEMAQVGKTSRSLWKKLDAARSSDERWKAVKEWTESLVEQGYLDKDDVEDFIKALKKKGIFKSVDESEKDDDDDEEGGDN